MLQGRDGDMTTVSLYDLRCEYRKNPIGLGVHIPRISWKIASERRGTLQTAYQIQVDKEGLFQQLVWDSGKVDSEQSIHIEYAGQQLESRTRYYYRVQIWDEVGVASAWSETQYWETSLLTTKEWQASWIKHPIADGPDKVAVDYMRKVFKLSEGIVSARIYATALGLYRLYVNGKQADDTLFTPGWTSYKHRLQYQTYDVTKQLQDGGNTIGVILGNGWYKGALTWEEKREIFGSERALLLQMHVVYADGHEQIISSDETWSCGTGALLQSELYDGELYDARLEPNGWHDADIELQDWVQVKSFNYSKEILIAQENDAVRIVELLKPTAVIVTPKGEQVLDFGQNMVGWVRFTIQGSSGQTITLRHAEVLDKEGNIYFGNLRKADQIVTYICKGGEPETFEPLMTFQGFRYLSVEGITAEEFAQLAVACVIHTDMEQTGSFQCSDDLLNQLQRNIVWGQRGNFLDVPTDCPQRDERLGWTGDAQMFIRTGTFNYGVAPFFTKWLKDLAVDQLPDGNVPHVIPDVVLAGKGSSAWGDAAVICPWTIYQCYGDIRILEEQFPSMKAWIEYIRAQGENEFLWNTGSHFGDWLGLDAKENSYTGATPKELIATAFYAYSTSLLVKAAEVLGYTQDIEEYRDLHTSIVSAFRNEFVTPAGRVASPTQTAYVLALMFDLLDEEGQARTAQMLAEHIEENGYHLTTGFVGTPYLCLVLSRFGYTELAYKLATQKEYPSWLYSVVQGATTIWEHWDGIKADGTFWSDDMNSFNHYAYGSIGDWFYRVVAGIDTDCEKPGYKHIVVRPQQGAPLEYAEATLVSMYGEIRSAWKHEDNQIELQVTIPANTTADIYLIGAKDAEAVMESGNKLNDAIIRRVANTTEGLLVAVGSGTYHFTYSVS